MPTPLLVVTPNPDLGESVRTSLEQTEIYRVFVVSSKVPAVVAAREEACSMAFLDLDLGEHSVEAIGAALRTSLPQMQLFVLAGDATPPALDTIRPWTLIRKPFRLPDVLGSLGEPSTAEEKLTAPPALSTVAWLSDVNAATLRLTRLTVESSCRAALMTRNNLVWAYAGELSDATAQELATGMSRSWEAETDSDLVRYVRLGSEGVEQILFATRLAKGMLLGMLFDADKPFDSVRVRATQLAGSLSAEATEYKPEVVTVSRLKWTPVAQAMGQKREEPPADATPLVVTGAKVPGGPDTGAPEPKKPIPASKADDRPTRPTATVQAPSVSRPRALADGVDRGVAEMGRTAATVSAGIGVTKSEVEFAQSRHTVPTQTLPSEEIQAKLPQVLNAYAIPGSEVGHIVLEPASAGVYHLAYACLLVPRFADHFLVGAVAEMLSEWMPILSLAFGWRLEYMAVRPEYLQWVANVPPATSPGHAVRMIRQETSGKILGAFPMLSKDNLIEDFWAPGFLIVGGARPHPAQLVKDYIQQVRQRQGKQ